MGDITNYVKIHKAVQAFCNWSLQSIEDCIKHWHQNQTLSPCQHPSSCPSYKKPTAKSKACQSCIDWGSAVAGECYPPGRDVQWRNVDATVLHKYVIEVAKGFVFILPHGQTCTSFDDFDVGGILKMMMGFKGYHGGDQACVDKIQKVVDIRNELSHMNVGQQMHIPDAQTSNYFDNIKDLVTDLEGRHTCLKADFNKTILIDIQSSDVTVDQIQQATKPLTDGLRQALLQALQQQTDDLNQHVTKHCSDIEQLIKDGNTQVAQALQNQTGELQQQLGKLSQDIRLVAEKSDSTDEQIQEAMESLKVGMEEHKKMLKEIKEEVSRLELKQTQDPKDEEQFLQDVKQQLVSEYRETRNRMQTLPGFPEEHESMEKAVTLEFSTTVNIGGVKYMAIESYDSFVQIKNDQEQIVRRILIKGNPACGKSTLMSKLAYDWAKNDTPTSAYAKFQLLFVLDMKEICPGDDLFDVIQKQLLPMVSKEVLKTYIASHAESVLFLLDGYDETPVSFPRDHPDFAALLSSRLFPESFVILTTRRHKVAEIINNCGRARYAQFELLGIPLYRAFEFIADAFQVCLGHVHWVTMFAGLYILPHSDPRVKKPPPGMLKRVKNVASLIAKVMASEQLLEICRCPMFLSMLCSLWKDERDFSLILTSLFFKAAVQIAKNRWKKNSDGGIDIARLKKHVRDVLLKLGKIALNGLMEGRLVFKKDEFDEATLNDAYDIGLVMKERVRSKLDPISFVVFIHKTFQEMSAAYYWASLADAQLEVFNEYLSKYMQGSEEVDELMLRICCGCNVKAAKAILQEVVALSCVQRDEIKEYGEDKCFLGQYDRAYDPWRLALLLVYESDYHLDSEELMQQLCSILQPLVSRLEIEANGHDSVSELWTVLKDFGRKAESLSDQTTWLDLVEEVYIADKTIAVKSSKTMGRSQFVLKDPAVAIAVPCMSNLKSLVIDGSSLHNCTCLLQNMATSSKASTKLTQFVCREYRFDHQAMASFLSRQKCLSALEIRGTSDQEKLIDLQEAKVILQVVVGTRRSTPLQVLVLDDFPLSDYVSCLKPMIPHLKELQVSKSYCKESSNGTGILQMISDLKRQLPLVKLSLKDSNKEGAGKSLAGAVKCLPKLECLNLWHGFNKEEPGLDEQDFKVCGPELRHLCNLTELDLGGNVIGNSVKELGQGLQYLTKLQSLILYHCKLTEESVEFLPLECLPGLRKLCLGSNKFGKGFAKLSEKLKFLGDLRDIELSCAGLTDEDVAKLPLLRFPHLISLDLDNNALGSDGLCTVAQQLKHIPLLESLRLHNQNANSPDVTVKDDDLDKGDDDVPVEVTNDASGNDTAPDKVKDDASDKGNDDVPVEVTNDASGNDTAPDKVKDDASDKGNDDVPVEVTNDASGNDTAPDKVKDDASDKGNDDVPVEVTNDASGNDTAPDKVKDDDLDKGNDDVPVEVTNDASGNDTAPDKVKDDVSDKGNDDVPVEVTNDASGNDTAPDKVKDDASDKGNDDVPVEVTNDASGNDTAPDKVKDDASDKGNDDVPVEVTNDASGNDTAPDKVKDDASDKGNDDARVDMIRGIHLVKGVVALLQNIHYLPYLHCATAPDIAASNQDITQSPFLTECVRQQILIERREDAVWHDGKCYRKFMVNPLGFSRKPRRKTRPMVNKSESGDIPGDGISMLIRNARQLLRIDGLEAVWWVYFLISVFTCVIVSYWLK